MISDALLCTSNLSYRKTVLKPLIPLESETKYLQAYAIAIIGTISLKPIVPTIKGLRIVSSVIVLLINSLF
jgi:hypothetical protein